MTFLVERLVELRRHLDHLKALRPRVVSRQDLERDLSLHNDVLFSLLMVAIRNLGRDPRFDPELVADLEPLPGFRNVLIHEYVALDLDRVVDALNRLYPVEQFAEIVRRVEAETE